MPAGLIHGPLGPLLACVLVVVLALVLARRLTGPGGATRACRWRRAPGRSHGTLTAWTCETCGVEAFSARRGPPRGCKCDVASRPL